MSATSQPWVAAADLERFAPLSISGGGPTAIEYAARNPERMSRLLLYGTYARGRYRPGEREGKQSRVLIDPDAGGAVRCPRSGRCLARSTSRAPARTRSAGMTRCSRPRARETWPHDCGCRQRDRHQRYGAPRHPAGLRPTCAAGEESSGSSRSDRLAQSAGAGIGSSVKRLWTSWIAIEPSPTAEATRLTEPCRTSPAASTPGTLVSSESGRRSSGQS
jgi:pimeloyl-ACP methyl ester carboxylesterase